MEHDGDNKLGIREGAQNTYMHTMLARSLAHSTVGDDENKILADKVGGGWVGG